MLFIDDITYMQILIDIDTIIHIGLYADDTKMCRNIYSGHDCVLLEKDMETLYDWSLKNKMHFQPDKFIITSHSAQNYSL